MAPDEVTGAAVLLTVDMGVGEEEKGSDVAMTAIGPNVNLYVITAGDRVNGVGDGGTKLYGPSKS